MTLPLPQRPCPCPDSPNPHLSCCFLFLQPVQVTEPALAPSPGRVWASGLGNCLSPGLSLPGCTPRKCGRGVTDTVITREEAERIRSIAEKGLSLGGSDGGASILDLHSGALSVGKHFVNLYRYFGDKIQNIFSEEDFQLYREVRRKVQLTIAEAFGISAASLHLTKPTFFSRINSTEARTAHDEYWHAHVDKVTYGSFDYTSLLYLSDYLEDFGGGRFVFMEEGANKTVEPRAGRVSFFTSGSENLHRVEKVRWGTRYAITIAFSCNPDHGIQDPAFP
ncbi:2-oxoglutarate and iron-dependent oxygenase domain-containing protein 3 [Sapajus apella]|uniref:2-oxoglutarate and iron-dependent oxygenase domain-containing protein 3 n=1 Tax=Sapajus apella TaxID=9515 RepID=A0A6J3EQV3_SAPAP|nr:2-oxoglutarate and iron-dependent oxygenase domain-containing protein 3 [Sapajus apella]